MSVLKAPCSHLQILVEGHCTGQGEEDFLIKAGRPSEGAWASPKGPKYESKIIPDRSPDHFDST